ncbi:hypothetical protein PoB_002480400 [Plakobranchus ocellatus]|uniref:Uncharacterized protein n=1 Tax=Plakobranchus ocellatus TaxID=259542 RepID=A0AAV3ZV46_9GAST|nr:hypothetical protein PoB_002480400 [Plakobranchus ocellatus]
MGACYSKNGPDSPVAAPNKAPRVRKPRSWRSKERVSTAVVKEVESPSKRSSSTHENCSSPVKNVGDSVTGSNSTSDPVKEAHTEAEKLSADERKEAENLVQARVAPSDSGIESIGMVQEDVQEMAEPLKDESHGVETDFNDEETISLTAQMRDKDNEEGQNSRLSKRLERLSRGSCHKCGNFRLDDSAFTALLTDTYCLCGPRRAGQPSVNPQCRTHGLRHHQSSFSHVHDEGQNNITDAETEDQTGHLETVYDSLKEISQKTNKDQHSMNGNKRFSLEILDGNRRLEVPLKSEEKPLIFHKMSHGNNSNPMDKDEAQTESHKVSSGSNSSDDILGDFPLSFMHKRKSLLSEILDITDSICQCDFYSNEIYCSPTHGKETSEKGKPDIRVANPTKVQLLLSSEPKHSSSCEAISKSSPALHATTKKCLSLSKNVSFAKENECRSFETFNAVSNGTQNLSHQPNSTQSKLTDSNHNSCRQENTLNSSSLSSSDGILMDGSESSEEDVPENEVFCDDQNEGLMQQSASDNRQRKTLSFSSIQHLVERSKEFAMPVHCVRRMFIDGLDSIVVPTEMYRQMEADLSVMKQQLEILTSLILEEQEDTANFENIQLDESFAKRQ